MRIRYCCDIRRCPDWARSLNKTLLLPSASFHRLYARYLTQRKLLHIPYQSLTLQCMRSHCQGNLQHRTESMLSYTTNFFCFTYSKQFYSALPLIRSCLLCWDNRQILSGHQTQIKLCPRTHVYRSIRLLGKVVDSGPHMPLWVILWARGLYNSRCLLPARALVKRYYSEE